MKKQTIQFAVESKRGVVQRVGRCSIYQPKTQFKGGSIQWLEDKQKKGGANNDR